MIVSMEIFHCPSHCLWFSKNHQASSSFIPPYPPFTFPLFLMLTAPSAEEYMAFSNPPAPELGGGACRCFRNMTPKANSARMTMTAISIPTRPPVDSPLSVKTDQQTLNSVHKKKLLFHFKMSWSLPCKIS